MNPKVFVSRNLSPDSAFLKVLAPKGFSIFHESLIHCTSMPIEEIPSSDWLFFYSKNGIKFALQNKSFKAILPTNKIAVMGKGSAQLLIDQNLTIDFVGNGRPEETAQAFLELAQGQQVLFVQAKHSRQSIQKLLGENIQSSSLIVYNNELRTDFDIPPCQYLLFTSPLNAVAYYNKYAIDENQKIIAIGATTATKLLELGINKMSIANNPSEEALIEEILKA